MPEYRINLNQNADGLVVQSSQLLTPETLWAIGDLYAAQLAGTYEMDSVVKAEPEMVPRPS